MAFIPVPDTAEAVLQFSNDGELAINTLYFTQAGGWTVTNLETLATLLGNWYIDNMLPLLASTLTLTQVICTSLDDQFGAQAGVAFGDAGEVATEASPNAVAACVSFRTGIRGRSFRGRNYIPGIPNAAIVVNVLDSGFIASAINAYQALLPGGGVFDGGVPLWTVVSRYSGTNPVNGDPVPRAEGITTQITTVVFSDNIVDTMRSRGPGRGR